MKIFRLAIILCVVTVISCSGDKNRVPASVVNIPNSASGDKGLDQLPVMEFKTLEHDFGKIIQGELVTYAFKFRNTGKSDLLIANISSSCGCTASEYPKVPIKPGEEEFIKVSFDSEGKEGFQNRTLTIAANTQPSAITLTIKAVVVRPERQ